MKKVISGRTILLNLNSNCTFVADDFDEEIQTGTRESDSNIEWVGELDIPVCRHEYKPISKTLWSILDDIDTSSGVLKVDPKHQLSLASFYTSTMKNIVKRHKYLKSDGFNLEINNTPSPNLDIKVLQKPTIH